MSAFPDVLIVGAGIVGAACARELHAAGLSVEVYEAGVVGAGASAAGMGHLVVIDEPSAELELSWQSLQAWQALAEELPAASEYQQVGTLWIAKDQADWESAQAKAQRLGARGIATRWLSSSELAAEEPQLRSDLAGALAVPADAVVYAPKVCEWWLRELKVHRTCPVLRVEAGAVCLANGQRRQAGAVLVAAGLATRELLSGVALRARKGHLAITDRYPGWCRHQIVELAYVRNAHGQASESIAFNIQPRPNGQLLVGSSRQFDVEDSLVEARMLSRVLRHAIDYMPRLAELSVLRAWTGLRAATADGLPLIGAYPRLPRVYLATGHEGLGITTALGTAQLIRALLTDTAPPLDPRPFCPRRFDA